jgi:hypothetical protein
MGLEAWSMGLGKRRQEKGEGKTETGKGEEFENGMI